MRSPLSLLALMTFSLLSAASARGQFVVLPTNPEPTVRPGSRIVAPVEGKRPTLGERFRRGDANQNSELEMADAIAVLNWQFLGRDPLRCEKAADANDDGQLDLADPLRILNVLFLGTAPLPAPAIGCGTDPTRDDLSCERYSACKAAPGEPANSFVKQELTDGRPGPGPIDDKAIELPPHVRVTLLLTELSHTVVSGGGVDVPTWASWESHSPEATQERYDEPVSLPMPAAGETWPLDYHSFVFYDGLVEDGCGNTPEFPISLDSWIEEQEHFGAPFVLIGQTSISSSTIQPNGVWVFSYTIRAVGSNGGVSDYTLSGKVTATCTNARSFD